MPTIIGGCNPRVGKTTTIRMITTLLPVRTGTIEVFGLDVTRRKMTVCRLIGYVPQQLSADSALTGRENVALFARLFDVPRKHRSEQVDAALTAVGLLDDAARPAGDYSGGMIRRLELPPSSVPSTARGPHWTTSSARSPVTSWKRPPEVCAMSVQLAEQPAAWVRFPVRVGAMCLVELQKIRRDRSELITRAIQPALWLLIFGEIFTRLPAIATGSTPYLDFLAPGILAQSALFIAIFYGILIIWERDAGVLAKLLVTPTPRTALIAAKAFAAGIRALVQAVMVLILAALLGVGLTANPVKLLGTAVALVLGSAFFCCLSIVIAGLVMSRERLMGIGQAITMPLFFGSNALYPVDLMPGWLQGLSRVNPLSYEVDALRGLLIGTPAHLLSDFGVLVGAAAVSIGDASALLGRLAR